MGLLSKIFGLKEPEPAKSEKPYKSKSCPDAGPAYYCTCLRTIEKLCDSNSRLHLKNTIYCAIEFKEPRNERTLKCQDIGPAYFRRCNKKPEQHCGREIQINKKEYICGVEFLNPLEDL